MSDRKYYSASTPKCCKYCKHGTSFNGGEYVFCKKKGRKEPNDKCLSYSYDILKRTPRRQMAVAEYKKEDMSID